MDNGQPSKYPTLPFSKRPDVGSSGSQIMLQSNLFPIILKDSKVFHYEVYIIPDVNIKKINRDIMNIVIHSYKNVFGNLKPVYDGKGHLYTRHPLHVNERYVLEFLTTLTRDKKQEHFRVILRYKAEINLGIFNEALTSPYGVPPFILEECVRALNVIIRYCPTLKYVTIGRSFFSPNEGDHAALGEGREMWFGYYQAALPSQWKMMLNVDVTTSPFHKSLTVVEYLWDVLGKHNQKDQLKPLTEMERQKFAKEMKGLKIEITHCGTMKRRHKVFNVTKHSARNQIFQMKFPDGSSCECTVEKYFWDKYHRELKYSHLPCLQVGEQHRNTYLPFEVCNVCPGQKCLKKLTDQQTNLMIEATARSAPERKNDIIELVNRNAYSEDPYLKEFNMNVSNTMVELKGRLLVPPCIQYGGEKHTQVVPTKGVWDMRDKQFHSGIEVKVWTIVCFENPSCCSLESIGRFSQILRKLSCDAGMPFLREARHYTYVPPDVKRVEPLFRQIANNTSGLQFLLVILPGKTRVYGEFNPKEEGKKALNCIKSEVKRVGDTILGIATQCVKSTNVTKPRIQKISNLCLKINVKLGGVNCILAPRIRPNVFNEPIIILGADLFLSSTGENKRPAIASLVGSMDAHPSRYAASVRVQSNKQENIQDLSVMVKELLIKFYQTTHFKPVRIILYRNVITESRLNKLLSQELLAIRHACVMLEPEYQPGITYIAINKRHHTRLFCVNKNNELGSSGNVPPGTTVDSSITHPTDFDFYLCSHQGVQGTSRPCHYQVLWDDNNLKSDEVQSLTYQLCYTYARCTRAVSIPAPAYYAHLVISRARFHFLEVDFESKEEEDAMLKIFANAIKLHKANDGMYFA